MVAATGVALHLLAAPPARAQDSTATPFSVQRNVDPMNDRVTWVLSIRGQALEPSRDPALLQFICPSVSQKPWFAVQSKEHRLKTDSTGEFRYTFGQIRFGQDTAEYHYFPLDGMRHTVLLSGKLAETAILRLGRSTRVLLRLQTETMNFLTFAFAVPEHARRRMQPMLAECKVPVPPNWLE